jgi:CHAT domain-containing protein
VLLFYFLGEKQSYLWAITPSKTTLFPLPPGAEIDSMVQRYRQALNGPQDVLASSEEGRALYRTLIAPAKDLLGKNAKVFIIPDGSLNNLNFETLVAPEPNPHYWIEDADIVNASSLRVLAASFTRESHHERKHPNRLLLIGDSVAPSKEYPELPRAGDQMASVARHFPAPQEQIYQRDQATPSAYLASSPEKFSHIHFVAHGTASRLSPLDSAIVLSKSPVETDSFKLYARDIVQHPMHADLVTISSCYGAGSRAYSGEGLVGLAWAFLRAGAHNVIASLWEVTDASTEQLMDRFYDELNKGSSPDAALRAAKLALLHDSAFHNPYYWAPFQLYTGS